MDACINKVELLGRLGSDPKITRWEDGRSVMRVVLATNEQYKTKQGNLREEVTWHRIVAWSGKGMPDFATLRKGQRVSVTGKLHHTGYEGDDGIKRQWVEIVASSLVTVDGG